MRASLVVGLAVSSLVLLGCPVGHQSPPARAQEAATELNLNTRFGRMEMATERVAPAARDAFLARRRAWGGNVRVADYELAGFQMKGENDAEMLVKVAWYRIDQGDLRVTMLKQKWHDFKGDWRLVDETRADGDVGLIGEPAPPGDPAKAGAKRAQFPTIRLGQPEPEPPTPDATPAPEGEAPSPAPTTP
ncbi:MAG: hypothetical protein KF764_25150 [Labilithrix sp.]|nr:hypothetical protein [Labilithrix sp.]MBX3223037.1 hypothetical protein [Labilithrix sp.]